MHKQHPKTAYRKQVVENCAAFGNVREKARETLAKRERAGRRQPSCGSQLRYHRANIPMDADRLPLDLRRANGLSMGYGMVSGSSSPKEVARSLLRTPVLYAMVVGLAVYLLQIPVPALIAQPLELLSNMNTPLSILRTKKTTGSLHATGFTHECYSLYEIIIACLPGICKGSFAQELC